MYKYLIYTYDAEGNEGDDKEIYIYNALNDDHAIDKAQEDNDAIIDGETGEPFVYKENTDTSWRLIAPKELTNNTIRSN